MPHSDSVTSLISKRKLKLAKLGERRKSSQEVFESMRANFETALKTRPAHKLHRHESLEKIAHEVGILNQNAVTLATPTHKRNPVLY